MAREFVSLTLDGESSKNAFSSIEDCRSILQSLKPSPDHFFWFEYNFLYVLAARGSAEKTSLGDHSSEGYRQRKRFYSISEQGKLLYSKRVSEYIIFLAQNTGLVSSKICKDALSELETFNEYSDFVESISENQGN